MEFKLTSEVLVPFIISNALAIWILWLSVRRANVAEIVLALLFLGAGVFNIYLAFTNPVSYRAFADTSILPFYRDFIRGPFSNNTTVVVSAIAVGQLYIGISMLMGNKRFRFGCIGGFLFGIAIAPLGVGSAFPSTLVLSLAFAILFFRKETAEVRHT